MLSLVLTGELVLWFLRWIFTLFWSLQSRFSERLRLKGWDVGSPLSSEQLRLLETAPEGTRLTAGPLGRLMLCTGGPPDAEEQGGSGFSTQLPVEVEGCGSGDGGGR